MKRVNNNYQCINVTTETYTGKEQSPKGVGFSAIGFDIGFEKEGVDKQLWVVQMKNNKKVWFRKSGMPKVTHEEPLITINEVNNDSSSDKQNIDDKLSEKDSENLNTSISITAITSMTPIIAPKSNTKISTKATSKVAIKETAKNNSETKEDSKKTDFNIFYKYYSNKLKDENKEKGLNKKPKEIQEETYSEWNRIKKNKEELSELLLLINNKT
jgi:hypothetical protein